MLGLDARYSSLAKRTSLQYNPQMALIGSEKRHQALKQLVGKSIICGIDELIRSLPEVSEITFAAYRPAPGLDGRLAKIADPTSDIREVAERLRQEFGIPFWDAVLAISMKRGSISSRYVKLAILHDKSPDEYSIKVLASEVSVRRIEEIVLALPEGFALAFSSKVRLNDGTMAHIPLLDFRCPPSRNNLDVVKTALEALGQESGMVVDSGRSYHFYGFHLLSPDAWTQFLAMSILFAPIVDVRYVAHRLADGACRLRIGTGPHKPTVPFVTEILG